MSSPECDGRSQRDEEDEDGKDDERMAKQHPPRDRRRVHPTSSPSMAVVRVRRRRQSRTGKQARPHRVLTAQAAHDGVVAIVALSRFHKSFRDPRIGLRHTVLLTSFWMRRWCEKTYPALSCSEWIFFEVVSKGPRSGKLLLQTLSFHSFMGSSLVNGKKVISFLFRYPWIRLGTSNWDIRDARPSSTSRATIITLTILIHMVDKVTGFYYDGDVVFPRSRNVSL
jgi:hypothetical protein